MTDIKLKNNNEPQCQFFVIRKKRLCRMTVRPGKQYCGEHEPQPRTVDNKTDKRIPCPNDPKHTCYISKLEKHLSICNARSVDLPPYIVHNINAPIEEVYPRRLLSQISMESLMQVIDKINLLYDKYIKDHITWAPEHPIHTTVLDEFNESDRTESSLRHLRQVSSLLWLAEDEGLVSDCTCYVELGAGKGQLSYYACCAWCDSSSLVLLVDRASLRHKRDNKLYDKSTRIRADLAHLALHLVPEVAHCEAIVGFAKHLCGIATDYALRCITAEGVLEKTKGIVLATCCHHRCEQSGYIANTQLQKLGINSEDLNAMLGMVSWATCGYGRSREARGRFQAITNDGQSPDSQTNNSDHTGKNHLDLSEELSGVSGSKDQNDSSPDAKGNSDLLINDHESTLPQNITDFKVKLTKEYKEQVGRRAKALFDWGRVLYLHEKGFEAKLLYYVQTSVSLENVCIVAKKVV